jgi:hypothetical protein
MRGVLLVEGEGGEKLTGPAGTPVTPGVIEGAELGVGEGFLEAVGVGDAFVLSFLSSFAKSTQPVRSNAGETAKKR